MIFLGVSLILVQLWSLVLRGSTLNWICFDRSDDSGEFDGCSSAVRDIIKSKEDSQSWSEREREREYIQ